MAIILPSSLSGIDHIEWTKWILSLRADLICFYFGLFVLCSNPPLYPDPIFSLHFITGNSSKQISDLKKMNGTIVIIGCESNGEKNVFLSAHSSRCILLMLEHFHSFLVGSGWWAESAK